MKCIKEELQKPNVTITGQRSSWSENLDMIYSIECSLSSVSFDEKFDETKNSPRDKIALHLIVRQRKLKRKRDDTSSQITRKKEAELKLNVEDEKEGQLLEQIKGHELEKKSKEEDEVRLLGEKKRKRKEQMSIRRKSSGRERSRKEGKRG